MLFGGDLRKAKRKSARTLAKFKREGELARCKVNGEEPPKAASGKFRRFLVNVFPPLREDSQADPKNFYERLYSPNSRENEVCRIFSTFLACQIVGTLFYVIISFKYTTFPKPTGTWTSVGVHLALCAVIMVPTLRAILLLAIPSLLTSKARTIILIVIITWAFQVPAMNITRNIKSTAQGVNCVQDNVKFLARQLKESAGENLGKLPRKKVDELLIKYEGAFNDMNEKMRQLERTIQTVVDMHRNFMEELNNIFRNCDEYAERPHKTCVARMNDVHRRCLELMFESLCKPVIFMRDQCRLTKYLSMQCEWPTMLKNYIVNGVGSYVKEALTNTMNAAKGTVFYELFEKSKNKTEGARNSYKSIEVSLNHSYSMQQKVHFNLTDFQRRLKEEIAVYETFVQTLGDVLSYFVFPLLVLPFVFAVVYLIRFVRTEKVDNCYITHEFRKVDIARETNGQPTLLPLLPKEKDKYIDAWDLHMVPKEKLRLALAIVLTLLSVAVPLVLIIVDILSYKILDKSYEFFHSNMTRITVPSMYRMKVSGEGFLNEILSAILATFEPITRETDLSDVLWKQCFQEPTPPDYALFQVMFVLFLICIILCLLQVYVKRTRHLIALHYFPKRARPRALYLYASIFDARKHLLDQMMKTAKQKKCEKGLEADEHAGRGNLIYKGLPMMGSDTHRCLRCARTDLKLSDASNARICVNCKGLYCVDCYTIRKKCLDCTFPLQIIAENVEFYVDSSCSDEDDT